MKKHVNIPIFIPHLGCPNQCVFCNQRTISGVDKFDISFVKTQIEDALSTINGETEAEIAFFGGSFTGIDKELMISLLEMAYEYVRAGKVTSIRCSTRPDYITKPILDILKRYGVKTIELGLQSYDDAVLNMTKRGHTALDEMHACEMIVAEGFDLVGQMMIGLPGSTPENELETARFIVSMGAMGARIYPTVVFKQTELESMADSGEYLPISLEDAVKRSARVLEFFLENDVQIIRIGLCASENLCDDDKYYAGPNHPALGEMVEGELYFNKISLLLSEKESAISNTPIILVSKGSISKAVGHKKINKERLISKFGLANVKFRESDALNGYEVKLEEGKKECI